MSSTSSLTGVLAITAPIFLLVGIGFLAVARNLVPKDGMRFLSAFLVNVAVPALLFKSISERTISDIVQLDFLLAYGLGSLMTFAVVFSVTRKILGKGMVTGSIYAMGGSFSNTLMVGYPVVTGLMGSSALVPFTLVLLVENFLMMPLTLALADIGGHKEKGVLKALPTLFINILKNPLMIAILFGVVFSVFNIGTPAVVSNVIGLLANSVVGVGLFVIGGMLVGFKYSGRFLDVSLILLAKLLLHPFLVLVMFLLIPGLDPQLRMAGVMLASVPMFGIYAVIGEKYGMGEICAAASVPTTIFSFVSITAIAWFLTQI